MPIIWYDDRANDNSTATRWVTTNASCTPTTTAYSTWIDQTSATSATATTMSPIATGGWLRSLLVASGSSQDWEWFDVTPTQYFNLAQERVVISRERLAQIETVRRAERERIEREYQARQQARAEANERARQLLLSHLTKVQRDNFERNNSFVVLGGRTKTRYRILGHTYSANIHVLRKNSDHVEHRLCCHCRSDIPLSDQLLAQKLSLQYDEDSFLRIANRHAAHGGMAYAA